MKLLTLRDNSRYTPLAAFGVDDAIVIASAVSTLFGGEIANKGRWEGGRFIPGDLDNRLQFLSQWMQQYGLTAYDIDKNLVDTFIYVPSGWQGQVSSYVQQTAADKLAHPENYYPNKRQTDSQQQNTNYNSGVSGLFGKMDISTILLVGAGVFMLAQVLGKGKHR